MHTFRYQSIQRAGQQEQFLVLPFGLNTSPQVFTHMGYTVAGVHCGWLSSSSGDINDFIPPHRPLSSSSTLPLVSARQLPLDMLDFIVYKEVQT